MEESHASVQTLAYDAELGHGWGSQSPSRPSLNRLLGRHLRSQAAIALTALNDNIFRRWTANSEAACQEGNAPRLSRGCIDRRVLRRLQLLIGPASA